jgi:hypothetical protein
MRKRQDILLVMACAGVTMVSAGCSRMYVPTDESQVYEQEDTAAVQEELQLQVLPMDTSDVAVLEMRYGEEESYPKLASFLAEYFEVPQDMLAETRYYYNRVDLNEDKTEEIVVAVVSEELENSSGHPLLILSEDGEAGFEVISRIDEVHTPVVIDDEMENGWHNVIPAVYGGIISPGYMVYHYENNGYQADEEDFLEELVGISGIQILSDNFIDDLDRGEYLTLLTEPEP